MFHASRQGLCATPRVLRETAFRGGSPKTDRTRSTFVFGNVFLHLHPVRTHRWSLRWSTTWGLGIASIASFILTLITGVLLMFYYKPHPEVAYDSIKDIVFVVPTGTFIRNIHRWAANVMVVTVLLHMARAFYTGAYRAPREFNWLIGMGLLVTFTAVGVPKSLLAAGIGHVVINLPLCFAIIYSQMGDHQANIERAARDLGAGEWQVLTQVTAPMLWPALFASFFLSMTFSWDEFIISFLLTRFDTTLPVEIWNLLRAGLNPKTNAVGSLVFGVSVVMAIIFELVAFRKRPQ